MNGTVVLLRKFLGNELSKPGISFVLIANLIRASTSPLSRAYQSTDGGLFLTDFNLASNCRRAFRSLII
jgi:hypothetical protein